MKKYYGERVYGSSEGGAPRLCGHDVYLAADVDARESRLRALAARVLAGTSSKSMLGAVATAILAELDS